MPSVSWTSVKHLGHFRPVARVILDMVYDSDTPVPKEQVIAAAAPLVHPAQAHREMLEEIERQRAVSYNPTPSMRRHRSDEYLVVMGQRRRVLRHVQTLIRLGYIIRCEYEGVASYAVGPVSLRADTAVLPVSD